MIKIKDYTKEIKKEKSDIAKPIFHFFNGYLHDLEMTKYKLFGDIRENYGGIVLNGEIHPPKKMNLKILGKYINNNKLNKLIYNLGQSSSKNNLIQNEGVNDFDVDSNFFLEVRKKAFLGQYGLIKKNKSCNCNISNISINKSKNKNKCLSKGKSINNILQNKNKIKDFLLSRKNIFLSQINTIKKTNSQNLSMSPINGRNQSKILLNLSSDDDSSLKNLKFSQKKIFYKTNDNKAIDSIKKSRNIKDYSIKKSCSTTLLGNRNHNKLFDKNYNKDEKTISFIFHSNNRSLSPSNIQKALSLKKRFKSSTRLIEDKLNILQKNIQKNASNFLKNLKEKEEQIPQLKLRYCHINNYFYNN